jgi:hypothetical protein
VCCPDRGGFFRHIEPAGRERVTFVKEPKPRTGSTDELENGGRRGALPIDDPGQALSGHPFGDKNGPLLDQCDGPRNAIAGGVHLRADTIERQELTLRRGAVGLPRHRILADLDGQRKLEAIAFCSIDFRVLE